MNSKKRYAGTAMGVLIGIIATLLIVGGVMGIAMLAMGNCPLCGSMMQ